MTTTSTGPPARGTRPPNRRDLVREAAAGMFADQGFARVSLNDVADAVNVGRTALYRYYSSKSDLLLDATQVSLNRIVESLPADGPTTHELVTLLVEHVQQARYVGVLWQRESRNLAAPERAALRRTIRRVSRSLAAAVRTSRPELTEAQAELLSACAIDAATSISFHHLVLPEPTFSDLLVELCMRVLALDVPDAKATVRSVSVRHSQARADQLIDAATALFAENGYAAVSVDDIGAAVGIAGPSVYRHFESKQDLLLATMLRGTDRLMEDLATASASTSPTSQLRRVSDAYVTMALDHSDLITVLIGETGQLDDDAQVRIRKVQRAVIDDWVALRRDDCPDEDVTVSRVKIQAAQMVANNVGRTPNLRKVPGFKQVVLDACWVLQQ